MAHQYIQIYVVDLLKKCLPFCSSLTSSTATLADDKRLARCDWNITTTQSSRQNGILPSTWVKTWSHVGTTSHFVMSPLGVWSNCLIMIWLCGSVLSTVGIRHAEWPFGSPGHGGGLGSSPIKMGLWIFLMTCQWITAAAKIYFCFVWIIVSLCIETPSAWEICWPVRLWLLRHCLSEAPRCGAALRKTDETLAITFQVNNDSFFSYYDDFIFPMI